MKIIRRNTYLQVCKLKTLLGKNQTVQRAANEFHRREAEDSMSFAPARMKPFVNGESSQAFSQDSFAEAIANIRRVTLIKDSPI